MLINLLEAPLLAVVLAVVLRYHKLLPNDSYRFILEKIFVDTDRKYAVFPGLFNGLTGLGDLLLGMYEFSRESRFLEAAARVAQGIMLFRVERRGIAFPGDSLSRLSCDYGTGSAGIALFLGELLLPLLDGLHARGPEDASS